MYKVAANLCVDEVRRRQRQTQLDLGPEAKEALPTTDRLDLPDAELREQRLAVWQATLTLPPQQRLALREWHGMSYAAGLRHSTRSHPQLPPGCTSPRLLGAIPTGHIEQGVRRL